MEVLRRCPLAIAQRLVHCAIAVSTAVLGRVTRTMSVALQLRNKPKRKKSNFRSTPGGGGVGRGGVGWGGAEWGAGRDGEDDRETGNVSG